MLAAYVRALDGEGPLENLEVGDLPAPHPRPGWSIVRVEAASLNHHDLWTLRGRSSQPVRPGQILGCDAAGVVVSHGADAGADGDGAAPAPPAGAPVVVHAVVSCGVCAACTAGDALLCERGALLSEGEVAGTLAELVAVPTVNLVPRPAGVDAVTGACLPTAYLTAYRMLFTRANLRPGSTVLVQGAGGGVATAALLLARAAGIRVVVTSRDETRRRRALELGAVAALAPDREAVAAVRDLTAGAGADAALETVGEPTWELSLRALRPGGCVVVAGATAGANPPARLNRVFWFQLSILGSTMGTLAELRRVVDMVAADTVRPIVDEVVPLRDVARGLRRLAAGEQWGKVVVTP